MKWIAIIILLGIGGGSVWRSSDLERLAVQVLGVASTEGDLAEISNQLRDWGITRAVAIEMLAGMAVVGLGFVFAGVYKPAYFSLLKRGAERRPKDCALEAAVAGITTTVVWLAWLAVVYMYLPLGLALSTFVLFAMLCIIAGLALSSMG